jgi:hypothetical protein
MSSTAPKCLAFALGVAAGAAAVFVQRSLETRSDAGATNERQIDLALGRAIIDRLPLLDKAIQLGAADQYEQAMTSISRSAWCELDGAWSISRKYNGALDAELRPLLLRMYPRLRQRINLKDFDGWPKTILVEMTNFMKEADRLTGPVESHPN